MSEETYREMEECGICGEPIQITRLQKNDKLTHGRQYVRRGSDKVHIECDKNRARERAREVY